MCLKEMVFHLLFITARKKNKRRTCFRDYDTKLFMGKMVVVKEVRYISAEIFTHLFNTRLFFLPDRVHQSQALFPPEDLNSILEVSTCSRLALYRRTIRLLGNSS